jgi:L-rhamnosyltransferase
MISEVIPGAVVVLFNPSDQHVVNLIRLTARCRHLIAIDNSPYVNPELHARIEATGIDVIANFNRGGVAGAYNRGLDRLIEKGAELLFLFDQDSEIPENYFISMEEACSNLRSPYFLVGPRILDVNVNRYAPAHVVSRFGIRAIVFTNAHRGLIPCTSIISSGSVISAPTYQRLGPFKEEYFIDQVDTEYCFRAACQGVPVRINPALTLKHQISTRVDRKLLFLKLNQWNMAPLRQYYSARNCIHIFRRYGAQFPVLALVNIITLQQIVSILLFERNKCRKFLAMMVGIVDGLRSRYGSFENCWPRISTVCVRAAQ